MNVFRTKDAFALSQPERAGNEGGASRGGGSEMVAELKYGPELTEEILKPGTWRMNLLAFGEALPDHSNRMYLDYDKLDELLMITENDYIIL